MLITLVEHVSFGTTYSETKSLNSCDQFDGLNSPGGGFLTIWNNALVGWMSRYGGLPLPNSIAVIPGNGKAKVKTNQQQFQGRCYDFRRFRTFTNFETLYFWTKANPVFSVDNVPWKAKAWIALKIWRA